MRPQSIDASLPLDQLRLVEEVCTRFEAAWQSGQRPRIEDYLGAAAGPLRNAMLRELLRLEIAYLLSSGEKPNTQNYLPRFPEQRDQILSLFDDHASLQKTSGEATTVSPEQAATTVFECSGCGKKLRISSTLLGKKVKCPACGNISAARPPGPSSKEEAPARKRSRCQAPRCRRQVTLPSPSCRPMHPRNHSRSRWPHLPPGPGKMTDCLRFLATSCSERWAAVAWA